MNETDWLSGADPAAMLSYLEGHASDRKLRLFACACARRSWARLRYAVPRRAVETAERFADGECTDLALREAHDQATQAGYGAPTFDQFACLAAAACAAEPPMDAARNVCENLRLQAVRESASESAPGEDEASRNAAASAAECRAQADLIREVFGNPFRAFCIEAAWQRWNNFAVTFMARQLYEERAFAELPYLADALEDAGCTQEVLLRHLREGVGHVRGCWAVDALLERG